MRVLLKFEINADADATWRAIHSPAALSELYGPLLRLEGQERIPTAWEQGSEAAFSLRALGIVPMGTQLIHVSDEERRISGERVRIMRDSGIPLSGPLAALDVWDHRIAVSPGSTTGTTLWRERLVIGGRAAPLLWPGLWAAWQWRRARISTLAPSWSYDLPPRRDSEENGQQDATAPDEAP